MLPPEELSCQADGGPDDTTIRLLFEEFIVLHAVSPNVMIIIATIKWNYGS